jgi:hypothetical protein
MTLITLKIGRAEPLFFITASSFCEHSGLSEPFSGRQTFPFNDSADRDVFSATSPTLLLATVSVTSILPTMFSDEWDKTLSDDFFGLVSFNFTLTSEDRSHDSRFGFALSLFNRAGSTKYWVKISGFILFYFFTITL